MLDQDSVVGAAQDAKRAWRWRIEKALRRLSRALEASSESVLFLLARLREFFLRTYAWSRNRLALATAPREGVPPSKSKATAGVVEDGQDTRHIVRPSARRASRPMLTMLVTLLSTWIHRAFGSPAKPSVIRARPFGVSSDRPVPLAVHPKATNADRFSGWKSALSAFIPPSAADDSPTREISVKTKQIFIGTGRERINAMVKKSAPNAGAPSPCPAPQAGSQEAGAAAPPSQRPRPAPVAASVSGGAGATRQATSKALRRITGSERSIGPTIEKDRSRAAPTPRGRPLPRIPSRTYRGTEPANVSPWTKANRIGTRFSLSQGAQRVVSADVKVRMRPEQGAAIAGELVCGSTVTVLERHAPRGWYFVKGPGGTSGYLREEVLLETRAK
ncbi:MAG: hypothetical protein IPK13_20850 [Deltaproteobacteria bacterium]|nr:hypothetical protein [Deltaproteobacteria bacterium]